MKGTDNVYRNFNFLLEIDGKIAAGFSEVTALESSADPIEHDKFNRLSVKEHFKLNRCSKIILKRGITLTKDLFEWYKQVLNDAFNHTRKDICIILFDERGSKVRSWTFFKAWPTKYDPDLNVMGDGIIVNNLEFTHKGMVRAK